MLRPGGTGEPCDMQWDLIHGEGWMWTEFVVHTNGYVIEMWVMRHPEEPDHVHGRGPFADSGEHTGSGHTARWRSGNRLSR